MSGILAGGGELGELIRTHDWASTPLGPLESWPQSLLTSVSIILNSHHPMWIGWGPEATFLYNTAYIDVLSRAKHPWALGRPAKEVWAEIWDVCGPLADKVFQRGEASFVNDVRLLMSRGDFTEETYWSFSYSPIRDEAGNVGGLFCPSAEVSDKILSERRLATLSGLSEQALAGRSVKAACSAAARTLGGNPADLPFAFLYLVDAAGETATRVEVVGECRSLETLAPATVRLAAEEAGPDPWGFRAVATGMRPLTVPVRGADRSSLPPGVGGQPIRKAVALPVLAPGQSQLTGLLVVGVNPCRRYDLAYQTFVAVMARQVGTALHNAHAYEDERRKAEALAELDRAKTAFFSNVSHEFRTPLTLMLGPLEAVLREAEDVPAPVRHELEVAHRNGLRLLKLVNTLLDFSRIEAGRVQAVYEPTDLAALTGDLASVFRSTIERVGLAFTVDCQPVRETTYVDRDMWEKIVLNLLSNAFKYTLGGRIAVRLRDEGAAVVLEVEDTGLGIPLDDLPRLFERFHRVEGAGGRTHEGSGIGLALVQELARLHGGQVTADSVHGQGSTFRVRIPTGAAHLPADRLAGTERVRASTSMRADAFLEEAARWLPAAPAAAGGSLAPPDAVDLEGAHAYASTAGKRVLLVDDNADMRDYVRRILGQFWTVETAGDGREALAKARSVVPDLVLTDVMMPVLDGFGLLHELRADERTRGVPVILLSARAGEESRVEGLGAGADDYLVKPFSARELIARVGAHLQMARVRAEAALKEQALRHEAEVAREQVISILESIGDGFMAMDADWRLTYVNAAAERINGRPRSELLGRSHWDLYPELLGSPHEAGFRRAVADQVPVTLESYYAPWDRWFEINATPREGGGLSIFFRDITVRKKAQAQLQEVFEQAPVGLAVLEGPAFTFTMVNDEYLRLWGGNSDIVGKPLLEVLPDAGEQGFISLLGRVYTEGRPIPILEMPATLPQPDGSLKTFTLALVFNPKRDLHGRTDGIVCVVIDVTARKAAEEARERLVVELQEADRRKDEFLAVLSHELRSPLNVISGHTELLRMEEPGSPEFWESVDLIEKHTQAQTQLVSDLLDVSRIITGKMKLDVSTVEVAGLVDAALDAVRFAAEAKGVRLERDLAPGLGRIMGDAMRLQQVLWNLLLNSVKFTDRGGRVTIRARRTETSVELTVSDTGQGITPEFLPHVFDRFHQEDASKTRKYGGLGLGLAIVRHVAELHGGHATAMSEGKGKGATFTVVIPVRAIGGRPFQDLSVLVVDDQPAACDLIVRTLGRLGASVRSVTSGPEALAALAGERFDTLLCDIGMPGMNGFELIRAWRRQEQAEGRPVTPAAALTAYASDPDRREALAAGFQSHLAKPVRLAELTETVARLAGRPLA